MPPGQGMRQRAWKSRREEQDHESLFAHYTPIGLSAIQYPSRSRKTLPWNLNSISTHENHPSALQHNVGLHQGATQSERSPAPRRCTDRFNIKTKYPAKTVRILYLSG